MVKKKEMLDKVLFDLESAGDVELSAIISKHGLLMVSTDSDTFSNETFAAVTATLYMSAESTTIRLIDELPESIVIETGTKHVIIVKAGFEALLIVLADNAYSPDLLLSGMKSAGEKIAGILKQ